MKTITENTLIPISLVITILGGASWLTTIWYDTKANAAAITEVRDEQKILAKELVSTQKQMIQDLSEIKTRLRINSQ